MEVLKKILKESKTVDEKFARLNEENLDRIKLNFSVPKFHPRSKKVKQYNLSLARLEEVVNTDLYKKSKNKIFFVDKSVSKQKFVKSFLKKNKIKPIILKPLENKVKTMGFLDNLFKKKNLDKFKQDSLMIIIGGGLLINIGAYLSEKLNSNLILFPTTVLSMADLSGGKVRVNTITKERAYKHYYKSFYEPNSIFLDKRFLNSLSQLQIRIGLVEIIKHGLFQSPNLYNYILKNKEDLLTNKNKLMKVILWAEDLKRVCIKIDVEENENGSKRILRGGHDFSDKLEEDGRLGIPHGFAVSMGIIKQLKHDKKYLLLKKARKIFDVFGIPKNLKEFKKLKK